MKSRVRNGGKRLEKLQMKSLVLDSQQMAIVSIIIIMLEVQIEKGNQTLEER